MKEKVILDTNFLIFAVKSKVRFFEDLAGYEIGVLESVLDELGKLANLGGADAEAAKIALQLVEDMETLGIGGATDSALVELSEKGYIIATQDKELQKRVEGVGGKIAFVRQGNHVEIG